MAFSYYRMKILIWEMLSEKKGASIMLPLPSVISEICHRFSASKRLRSHISHQTLSDPVPIRTGAPGCHHGMKLLINHRLAPMCAYYAVLMARYQKYLLSAHE